MQWNLSCQDAGNLETLSFEQNLQMPILTVKYGNLVPDPEVQFCTRPWVKKKIVTLFTFSIFFLKSPVAPYLMVMWRLLALLGHFFSPNCKYRVNTSVSVDINSNNSVPLPLIGRWLDVQLHSVMLFIFHLFLHCISTPVRKLKVEMSVCVTEFKTVSPGFACETIPALVWLMMALSHPFKDHFLLLWLCCDRWCNSVGFVPTGDISSSPTLQICQDTNHLWWLYS